MSLFKLFLIITGMTVFLCAGKPVAFAQDVEPDFSNFDDPAPSSSKKQKSKTEAGPPCTTCGQEHPKPKNQKDLEKVAKKAIEQNKSAKKKKQVACVTCGEEGIKPHDYPVGVVDTSWSQFPKIAAYSNSPQVAKMIDHAKRNQLSSSHKRCYRWVKGALCGLDKKYLLGSSTSKCSPGSMVSSYPSGSRVSTKNSSAIQTLKHHGFVNLLDDPTTRALITNPAAAPKGAILVYKGGRNGGHIEIKTGTGGKSDYISDFNAPDSILRNDLAGRASRNYQLVGVMIKEDL